jgi:hypothetical protein
MLRGVGMPKTEVVFFASSDGACPFLLWFGLLPEDVRLKCMVKIERLAECGYELRRPEADLLRDGIYELRASRQGIHYRMLYFFHNRQAVLWSGIVKESRVPDVQIERAICAKRLFELSPTKHTYTEENE